MHREHEVSSTATSADAEEDAMHAAAHAARRAEIAAMSPAERFALMDALCRQITWLAANARRVQ